MSTKRAPDESETHSSSPSLATTPTLPAKLRRTSTSAPNAEGGVCGDTPFFPVPGAFPFVVAGVHDSLLLTSHAAAGLGHAGAPVAAPVATHAPVSVGVVTVRVFLIPEEEGPFPGCPPPAYFGDAELVVPLEGGLEETVAAVGSLWVTAAMAGEDAAEDATGREGFDWDTGTKNPEWNARQEVPLPDRAGFYTEGVKLVHAVLLGLQLSLAHPSIKVNVFSDGNTMLLRGLGNSDAPEASIKIKFEVEDEFRKVASRNVFPVNVLWRGLMEQTDRLLGLPVHVQQVTTARAEGRVLATSTVVVFFEEIS